MNRTPDGRYAAVNRVAKLEQEVESLRLCLAAQIEIVTGLREMLAPIPVDVMFRQEIMRRSGDGTVRQVHGVGA